MPRFYFHISSKDEDVPDHDGMELKNLAQAHDHAMTVIRDTLPFVVDQLDRGWLLDVADANGRVVLTVPYRTSASTRSKPSGEGRGVPRLLSWLYFE